MPNVGQRNDGFHVRADLSYETFRRADDRVPKKLACGFGPHFFCDHGYGYRNNSKFTGSNMYNQRAWEGTISRLGP